MKSAHWRLSLGAELIAERRTRFQLWAPAQQAVAVVIDGRTSLPMTRADDGSFAVEADCGAGTRYRFRLQDGLTIPDPAARAQDFDVHGWSVVIDPTRYQWRHREWRGRPWHEAVIYELHVGLCGGFDAVARDLPRLSGLGFTAVELMPIAEFPGGRNWGYDGVLPFAPESSYGSPDALKALIDAAHDNGMMIFLDVVYNHLGPDGNYLPTCAPAMFRADVKTPWGPALDFRLPQVRRFFIENALYWLMEYRFDGLRFDAVHAITESDWLYEMAAEVRRTVEPGRHVHLVLENDDNIAQLLARGFDAQWNDDGHHVLHVLLTGEHEGYYGDYANGPAARLARCLKEGFIYQGESSRHRGGKQRGTPSADLPPTAFVLFLQNHDQIGNRAFGERLTTLANPAALEAAIALQLLCPQVPLVFMGEEHASTTPFLFFTDHNAELAEAVREGRRREFAAFAQFASPQQRAQIPDPNAIDTFARSRPLPDAAHASERDRLYRTLLALRRIEIVPRLAGTRAFDARPLGPAAVMARWRAADGVLLLACNLDAAAVEIPPVRGRFLFASSDAGQQAAARGCLAPRCTLALMEAS